MPDLVQDGRAHLADQVLLAVADQLDVFLENEDVVRGRRASPLRLGAVEQALALVDAQEEFVVIHSQAAKQPS